MTPARLYSLPMGAPLVHRLRVRYSECDRQGVVFNANYLAFFDHALTELWRAAFGGYDVMVRQGVDVVVAEARVRYRRPARFDDELDLSMAIVRIGETSVSSAYEVRRAGELLAEGETRHVFVDAQTLQKTSTPEWARTGLQPWVVQPQPDSAQPLVERQ
jgi:acyl-CoA thioester hydrolase